MYCFHHFRRTLRVLLAIARGVIILSEDWIYASISAGCWQPIQSYRHPKYMDMKLPYRLPTLTGQSVVPNPHLHTLSHQDMIMKTPVFLNKRFYVLHSTSPSTHELALLITAAGGNCLQSFPMIDISSTSSSSSSSSSRNKKENDDDDQVDFFVVGNIDDTKLWIELQLLEKNHKIINLLEEILMKPSYRLVNHSVSLFILSSHVFYLISFFLYCSILLIELLHNHLMIQ